MNSKINVILLFLIVLISCAKKPTQDDIVAEELKGKWNTVSIKIDNVETFDAVNSTITTTFFDIENNIGRYNLKIFEKDSLISQTEGTIFVTAEGKTLIQDEDGIKEAFSSTIIELSKDVLKLQYVNANNKNVLTEYSN